LAEARKKKRKCRESPKTPPGSSPHQPPPPPPPTGPSRTSEAPRAFGSQVTPPPPPPTSTSQDSPSKGSATPSPSKTAASTKHQAWTTPDVMLRPFKSLTPTDLDMDEAMGPDEQAQLPDDEDIESAHIPMMNLRVAVGYKNPLCLTRAKQVQPALYNGHEIIKNNHASTIVHNTEDTLEIAEITRKKMNAKINDPECLTRKVKISPHDYSKENFLATFTPQKQLTPKQIFWSNDLMKLKSEALKERTKVSRPIKALIVGHSIL
nr:hypothetical protein [Tanacetum cinerariifolium]